MEHMEGKHMMREVNMETHTSEGEGEKDIVETSLSRQNTTRIYVHMERREVLFGSFFL